MKRTKMVAMLAGAALAGVVAGTVGCSEQKPPTDTKQPGTSAPVADKTKHACKGQNECKGLGGCKTDKNECKGQNACKGQGGCKTS